MSFRPSIHLYAMIPIGEKEAAQKTIERLCPKWTEEDYTAQFKVEDAEFSISLISDEYTGDCYYPKADDGKGWAVAIRWNQPDYPCGYGLNYSLADFNKQAAALSSWLDERGISGYEFTIYQSGG